MPCSAYSAQASRCCTRPRPGTPGTSIATTAARSGITEPINDEQATAANGGTIGFKCSSPEQVRAFHEAGLANGGSTCEDPPGERDGSLGRMFVAYVRDPDGNKLCAIHRMK